MQSSSSFRYPTLIKVVQAALTLTHGSADVERGFSESGRILTDERSSMSEKALNARFAIVEGLKRYDCKVHKVPITVELLKLARSARHAYHAYLDEQKRKEEEKKREN